jgi:hypothetical protein
MWKITLGHRGYGGTARAVIASGEAVGTVYRSASVQDGAATFWDAQGQAFQLPGPLPSEARDLNEAWTVAGLSASCPRGQQAMRWWPTEGREECLESTPSGSFGNAIDGQHRVWGQTSIVVTVWEVGKSGYTLWAEAGGQSAVLGSNEVLAVGYAERPGSPYPTRAAHYRFPPAITLLPAPGPISAWTFCVAWGINASLVTVGWCDGRAMLWPNTTTVIDLNTVVQAPFTLETARGINDAGEIIGTSAGRNWLLTPIAPSLAMRLNQTNVAPGQTLRMALDMHNPGPMLTTDVYVGIILPDGKQVVFLTNLSPLEGQLTTLSSNPRLFARLLQGVSWPANLHATQENYWVYTRSGLEANGTYHLVIAWTKPNNLEDGGIDEGDILALDWKAVQFTGPASNLAAKARD